MGKGSQCEGRVDDGGPVRCIPSIHCHGALARRLSAVIGFLAGRGAGGLSSKTPVGAAPEISAGDSSASLGQLGHVPQSG